MGSYPYPEYQVKQKQAQGYVVLNTVKWRNRLIYFLFAVIVGLGAYIAYLHLRDQCADCKIDTPFGQMSCSFLGTVTKTMKQNPGNSGMGQSGLQGLPDQSGLPAKRDPRVNRASSSPQTHQAVPMAITTAIHRVRCKRRQRRKRPN